ncbi:MAG: VIT domain-containing protein, partial [Polyangiales bacterium]
MANDAKMKMCDQLLEHLAEAIDSELPKDLEAHLDSCDACRDLVHDAMATADRVRDAGEGYVAPIDLEQRVLSAIDERSKYAPKTEVMEEAVAEGAKDASPGKTEIMPAVKDDAAPARDARMPSVVALFGRSVWRQRRTVGAGLALAAAVTIGVVALRPKNPSGQTEVAASAPWKGQVAIVVGSPDTGLMLVDAQGATKPLHKGDKVAAGAHLRTDVRTRARIELDDGSAMVLDRGADVFLDGKENRAAKLVAGSMVVEVKATEGADAKVSFPGGTMTSGAAKVSFASQDASQKGMTSVAVAKGVVSTTDDAGKASSIASGEGGTIGGGATNVGTAGGLSSAFGWSELGETDLGDKAEVPGIGELRARLPGAKNDGDKPLKLTKQSVKIRIAGEIARTEIEETFSSDDPQVLEGIFKFPLPPDAQIERLALDVDGKLEEGSFVDKEKGQKIWKGVTYNAQPTPIKPAAREEYIWVPGPWHDPALLEWNAGGRMELKIYPIPAKGSRRVIVAYTQRIAPSAGVRRYVYPLPHFSDSKVAVDDFSLDMQVMGQDVTRGVKVKGYEIETTKSGDAVKATFARKAFVPSGDVVIEYARQDEGATATTYAYQAASGGASYVALSLAPVLPRLPDNAARTQVIVVDTSRSMVGERFTRATAVAARLVDELDPRDRYAVLACDVTCTPLAVTAKTPTKGAGDAVKKFLSAITPDGAADVVSMVDAATMFAKKTDPTDKSDRKLRVVYIGDGTASIGARTPAALEAGVKAALAKGADAEASVTTVSVGVDVDAKALEAIARGGGGVVVPYVAGEKLGNVALDILEATYGTSLRDAQLTLPQGLEEIAPARLGSLRAGDEALVVARMSGKEVTGEAKLEGTVGGKPWSTTFPIAV